jgi:hypothetical protein
MPEQPRLVGSLLPLSVTAFLMPIFSLHQFLNGWMQGVNAYEMRLGKYHNVECP